MSDKRMIIRRTNLPTRCEICHLSDQFDPGTLLCRRCAGIMLPASSAIPAIARGPEQFIDRISHLLGISFLLTICSFACLVLSLSFVSAPLLVIFACLAVVLTLGTLLLFVCYCGYWCVWAAVWITGAVGKMVRSYPNRQ
jgi:hypothetical protein